MHDAQFHFGPPNYALESLSKVFQVVDAGDVDVLDAAILPIGQDLKIERMTAHCEG